MAFALFKKFKALPTPASEAGVASRFDVSRATPYLLTDLHTVRTKVTTFHELLPSVDIYYAIKANSDAKVIKAVSPLVAGYDIASLGELEALVHYGIAPERVRYSNPVKIPEHIAKAYKLGVRYFAFDSIAEIEKIAAYAPGSNVYLRLKVSDYGSKFPLSKKFGVDADQGVEYCVLAQKAGLHVCGVTFHVGSQSENVQVWHKAIEIAGNTIRRLQKRGMKLDFLDLGGGFPADYGEPAPTIDEVATAINTAVKQFVPRSITLIAEPGRYIVANAGTLVCSVIGREHRSGSDWLYLDMGTFQGLIEPLEMPDLKYPVKAEKESGAPMQSFVLSGPSCDAYDTIGPDYLLPADVNVGDRIAIDAAGAYSLVYASTFNGFEPPKVYYVGA